MIIFFGKRVNIYKEVNEELFFRYGFNLVVDIRYLFWFKNNIGIIMVVFRKLMNNIREVRSI